MQANCHRPPFLQWFFSDSAQVTIAPENLPAFINNASSNYGFIFSLLNPPSGVTRGVVVQMVVVTQTVLY
jgi:hypothetical protein